MPPTNTKDTKTNVINNEPNVIGFIRQEMGVAHKKGVHIPQQPIDASNAIRDSNFNELCGVITDQVEENEEKKRQHKDLLLRVVSLFLGFQFGLYFLLLLFVIIMISIGHMTSNDFADTSITLIFDMLKVYLASIIVELISMLYFIVRNVFDTTIPDLAKRFFPSFKEDNDDNKEK